jgi:hypothetical protein
MAAIWRAHGGTYRWGNLTWLNEDRGGFTYGSALSFIITMPVPVYDDPLVAGIAKAFQATAQLVTPDGASSAVETNAGP